MLEPLLHGGEIALVKLHADKVAPSVDTGHASGARAGAIVEYGVALFGVDLDQVLKQRHRLLGRMQPALFWALVVECEDVDGSA